jgi:hypothetical protein
MVGHYLGAQTERRRGGAGSVKDLLGRRPSPAVLIGSSATSLFDYFSHVLASVFSAPVHW